jgi:type IV pilus assembly protein PilV
MTGILTTQMVGIKITQNAYHRTQATTLAYQMTDYLRANCSALSDYAGLTFCHAGNRGANDERDCTIDAASDDAPETVAEDDLNNWWTAIDESGLPNWYAKIAQAANTSLVYVVVQWDDTHSTEGSMNPDELEEAKTSCLETAFPSSETAIPAPMEEVCLTTLPCAL